jgi:hypothetical protein
MEKVTQKQIQEWKKEHGEVIKLSADNLEGYIKKPDRKVLSLAMTEAQVDPFGMIEVILTNCWLGGDDEMKNNDSYLMGINAQIDKVIEIKTVEIKKL